MNNENKKMWMVRAGEGAKLFNEFIESGKVEIDFHAGKDISRAVSPEEIIEAYNQYLTDNSTGESFTDRQIKYKASVLFAFCRDMQVGELVITCNAGGKIYKTGRITGTCQYRGDENNSLYSRTVKWSGEINRENFSDSFLNFLTPKTLIQIKEKYREELFGES